MFEFFRTSESTIKVGRSPTSGLSGHLLPVRSGKRILARAGLLAIACLFANASRAADAALIAAAQKEGHVVWYTTQILNQFARPAADAFQKTYGISVDVVRADASEVALRILNEARAGKVLADVFDGTTAVVALKKAGLVLKWSPDSAQRLPSEDRDGEGYWTGTNLYVITPGFNTDLIPKGSEPRAYADLLDPRWKGRMVWNSSPAISASAGFIGVVLAEMGEDKGMEYLRALSRQNIAGLQVAARQVLDQVIAGEFAIALGIFNNHAVISAAQGAPVAWIAMNPAMSVLSVVSVIKEPPHPNAGKLLVDFLVSEAGQKIYRDADYMPIDAATPARDESLRPDGVKFRAISFTPERIVANMPKWSGVFQQLFR